MRYADYHPEYADHKPYFDRVGENLGLTDTGQDAEEPQAEEPEAVAT